jgi:hypothetical protein
MNLNSMTKIDYNDPIPPLGKRVLRPGELWDWKKEYIETWKPHDTLLGFEISSFGKLRTNFELPKGGEPKKIDNMASFKQEADRLNREMDSIKLPGAKIYVDGDLLSVGTITAAKINSGIVSYSWDYADGQVLTNTDFVCDEDPNWRFDNPLEPGIYVAATVIKQRVKACKNLSDFKNLTKYWDGSHWFQKCKIKGVHINPVHHSHAVIWNQAETERQGLNRTR